MTLERFREVLKEYNILGLTSVRPENITEEELRKLAQILISYRSENDTN